jgi:hypothetical protein|tara:strand:+ start:819 stop:1778 length:960 start_codon:yes stop_codon:yes gene_type:complete
MATETVRNLPAQFIEDIGKDLATQITAQTAIPVVAPGTAGLTKQAGESQAQFDARTKAGQQFDIRQDSLAGLAPQVAGLDALQTQAQGLATTAATAGGLGSFQPYLTAAQNLTGPMSATQQQQYMSPYQSQVMEASLAEFDRNAAINRQQISDQAVQSGAFGGGREGVMQSEYQLGSDRNRALLQAGMLQEGFNQAQAQRGQDLQTQLGLMSAVPGLQTDRISTLGQLGAMNQAQTQAGLDATREANRMSAFMPQEQMDRFAGQVTGLMGGYPAQYQTTNIPNPTPLQTAVGLGTAGAGIFRALGQGAAGFKGYKTPGT